MKQWLPPRSPFGLIQEDLFPAEWLILVSCIMLNCTNRKQVEQVLPEFIKRWPDPVSFLDADVSDVETMLSPLGFGSRRSTILKRMTESYLTDDWSDAEQLPGIGEYGATAWRMFCKGLIPEKTPNDGALALYHRWLKEHQS